jgi:uncharacterized membrane protein YccC
MFGSVCKSGAVMKLMKYKKGSVLSPELGALFKYAANCRSMVGQDNVRMPLQTVVAVLLACAWMNWLNLPELAWGAFSALFVVRASVEGTVGEAAARVLGALLGVALGVSLVLAGLATDLPSEWSIVLGVSFAAFLSTRWPNLSYSLVTVTMLTVAPGTDVLDGATDKTLAIFVGSASGILAAIAVLPLSARRSMRENLAASIQIYGDLLLEWAAALQDGRERPRENSNPAMKRARWRASDMACQSRSLPLDLLRDAAAHRLHDRIDELWRTIPLMERVGRVEVTENVCRQLGPTLSGVATHAKKQIDELAGVLREECTTPPRCRTGNSLDQLREVISETTGAGAFNTSEQKAVELIYWAWQQVADELNEMCNCLVAQGITVSPIAPR